MPRGDSSPQEQAKHQLARLREELHKEFPGATARLEQLDSHIGTVVMVIDHLYDEADRMGGYRQ